MVEGKKSKKRTVIVSSLILSVLAVLPSYAATETIARGTEQWLAQTIASKTRVIYRWQEMKKGDAIVVMTKCEDSSVTYRIGIKNSAGNMIYKQGTGSINHFFTIEAEGTYSVYVENTSSKSMNVTGSATYPH